ncbi:MAG: hypothetical protein AB8G22_05255 [Saprospiraceae bacterium]
MKTLLFLLTFCITSLSAQEIMVKKTEKTYDLATNQAIDLNLKFAKNITIRTWNQPQLKIVRTLKTDQEEMIKRHVMKVQAGQQNLEIIADLTDHKTWKRFNCTTSCDQENRENSRWGDRECACSELTFEITLPATANLRVETINGDIEIRDFNGRLHAKSINGFVDVDWEEARGADIYFHTIHGDIYSDFALESTLRKEMFPKIRTDWQGGGEKLELETINGNIFFRKSK